jgi:hypothetical protein
MYREKGETELIKRAWEYRNAENLRHIAEQNEAVMIMADVEIPFQLAESLERFQARAQAVCDAFVEEYEFFRKRQTERE